jgi:hypothetical protein
MRERGIDAWKNNYAIVLDIGRKINKDKYQL